MRRATVQPNLFASDLVRFRNMRSNFMCNAIVLCQLDEAHELSMQRWQIA